jgi:hypothetical protein
MTVLAEDVINHYFLSRKMLVFLNNNSIDIKLSQVISNGHPFTLCYTVGSFSTTEITQKVLNLGEISQPVE